MDINPDQRPIAIDLFYILYFWLLWRDYNDDKKYGYYGKEIEEAF